MTTDQSSRSSSTRRRWLIFGLRVALTIVVLWGLIALAGGDRVADSFRRLSLVGLVAGVCLHIAGSILVPAIVSHLSLRTSTMDMSLPRLIAVNFSIRFYSMVLPRASATGVRWMKYQRAGSRTDATALVVLEKVIQVAVYSTATVIFIALEMRRLGNDLVLPMLVAVPVMLVAGMAMIAFFSSVFDRGFGMFRWLVDVKRIGGPVAKLRDAVVDHREAPSSQVALVAGWTALGFVFFVGSALVVSRDVNLDVPILALAWMRGLIFIGTLIPTTIAGIGVREGGFVAFLDLYGIAEGEALGFAIALLALQVVIGAIGAATELTEGVRRYFMRRTGASSPS